MLLATGRDQPLAGEGGRFVEGHHPFVHFVEQGLDLAGFTGALRHFDAKAGERLGQFGGREAGRWRRGLARRQPLGWRGRAAPLQAGQDGFGLALQAKQSLHLLFGAGLLGAELQQGRGAKHLGGAGRVLFPGELEQQLVVADGLEGGFRDPQAVDAAIEHVLDGFELLPLHLGDRSGRHHLQGELAAAAQVEAQLEGEGDQNGAGGDGQGQDQGKPPLLACHLRSCPT